MHRRGSKGSKLYLYYVPKVLYTHSSEILRDETMDGKFIYIPNNNKQSYPLSVDYNYWLMSLDTYLFGTSQSKFNKSAKSF